ncbi:MAG: hypothetical protein ACK58L_00175 [Planctomycetota bacterium]
MHGNVAEWVIDQYHADATSNGLPLARNPAPWHCLELRHLRMCTRWKRCRFARESTIDEAFYFVALLP